MDEMSIAEILEAVEGKTQGFTISFDTLVKSISTDSRKISPGEVFVALSGEKMDGHDYIETAAKKGAMFAIIEENHKISIDFPVIIVRDTLVALNKIAAFYRKKFDIPVVGVTGSTGKTSTKELIAAVLSTKFNVHKTMMNFNNEIGLPMTVFEMKKEHQVSVLELGMNHAGEIKRLSCVAKPQIGVITNIGTAHIENLLNQENILKSKLEITTYFDKNNLLVLNGDDKYLKTVNENSYEIKTVSLYNGGDYNAIDIINLGEEGVRFKCYFQGKLHEFRLHVPGTHNIYNALNGIVVGDYLGLSPSQIAEGIENYRPVGQRMNIINLDNGIKLINDYYNANPDSMRASLNVLGDYITGRRIAVLGDMYELGEYSKVAHIEIGNYALAKSDVLIAVGDAAIHYYDSYRSKKEAYFFSSKIEAVDFIKTILKADDVVLIKASNGMKMGEIADCLIKDREKVKE